MITDDIENILKEYHTVYKLRDVPYNPVDAPQTFAVADLKSVSKNTLYRYGFVNWDDSLLLIPVWAFNLIKDGEVLTSISGSKETKGKDYIDLDSRAGALAFGFKY